MRKALIVAAVLAPMCARAQDMSGWYESLKQPDSGISCCSIADCAPADYRIGADGYYVGDERVPDEKILHGKPNPTGRGVLCRSPVSRTILCFVPASET